MSYYVWKPAPEPVAGEEDQFKPETEEERRARFDVNMEGAMQALLEREQGSWEVLERHEKMFGLMSRVLSGKDEYGADDINANNPLAKIVDELGDLNSTLRDSIGTGLFEDVKGVISRLVGDVSGVTDIMKSAMEKTLGNAALDALRAENQRLTMLLTQLLGKEIEGVRAGDLLKVLYEHAVEAKKSSDTSED